MTLRAWPVGTLLIAAVLNGCSDPVPPAPRGNLVFNLTGCTSYSGGIGPSASASDAEKFLQLPATDGTRPGRRLEDGEEGASIRCAVDGGDTNRIEASIHGTQRHPSATFVENIGIDLAGGWIQKQVDANGKVIGGAGEAMITVKTGGVGYESVTPCALSINSTRSNSEFTVDAGRVYASFNCPSLQDPPVMGCRATGAFVLERCKED